MNARDNRIDANHIDAAKHDIVDVISRYVELKKSGAEFVSCCPFHSEKSPSFKVNPAKGIFHCFGCGASGDAIEFVIQHENVKFPEAVRRIVGDLPDISNARIYGNKQTKTRTPAWQPIRRVPPSAPVPTFRHWRLGDASAVWQYRDYDNTPLGYVCRFENEDGGKETLPLCWAVNTATGEADWRFQAFASPRSLYRLDELSNKPAAPVIVVEGEKTAEAAALIFPSFAVVSWPGGTNAVQLADWQSLHGRDVILWPDADWKSDKQTGEMLPLLDQPGVKAMRAVFDILHGQASQIRIVPPVSGSPDGWDLADAPPFDGFSPFDYAKTNVTPAAEWFAKQSSAPTKPAPPQSLHHVTPGGFNKNAIDWYAPFQDVSPRGKPLGTIDNAREAIQRLGMTVRYNVINKEIEIIIPGAQFTIDNEANASLAWVTSQFITFGLPVDKLGDYLCYLADSNPYNPVANWITSRPWDRVSRLPDLYATITAEDEDTEPAILQAKEAFMRRWLISAVAAAFLPDGISAKGVLVLQGEQNVGKTSWFKSLAPAHLGVIQDGLTLRPDDKDSVKQIVSHWMVELGELDATFRKSDISQLKSFITRSKDTLRRAYDRRESHYARRTVFFASVNPRQFLHDTTGNTRYWTISCSAINHKHTIDMQQVWAEVYESLYLTGESWFLSEEENKLLTDRNHDFDVIDPIKERLLTTYDWEAIGIRWRWLTATEVMLEIGYDKSSRADVTSCGTILSELNGKRRRRSNGKNLLHVPPKFL